MNSAMFRDFDAETAEVEGDPIQYKLGGVTFTCVNPVPLGKIVVMTRRMVGRNLDNPTTSADIQLAAQSQNILWEFTVPEQHDELDRVVSSLRTPGIIQQIVEYISQAATGRPTLGS